MSKVLDGPITIRGDLIVTGRLNKGLDTAQANNGKALQVIQDVLQPVVTQPNVVPASGDVRMYGQNVTINGNVVPGGTDGYFQIDEYINGAWQHLFEVQPSTTGNANVLDLFISGRIFARDSVLSAPGRFFFKPAATPFTSGTDGVYSLAYGVYNSVGRWVAVGGAGKIAYSTDGGLTWAAATTPFGASTVYSVAFGNGIFVAVGASGKIARSTDGGATWGSLISNPFSTTALRKIIYQSGIFIICADYPSQLARSTDYGVSWGSLISNPFSAAFLNVWGIAGNGANQIVAAGGTKISVSNDNGVTWAALINTGLTYNINDISFGLGIYITVGNSGGVARSTNGGASWTVITVSQLSAYDIDAVCFGQGIFMLAASKSLTDGAAVRSLDLGVTWGVRYNDNGRKSVFADACFGIGFDGGKRFMLGGFSIVGDVPIAYTDYVEAGAGIVESGSNSNGSYIKFDDGTMECRFASVGKLAHASTVTFPVPFISAPDALALAGTDGNSAGNYAWIMWYNVTESNFQLALHDHAGGTTSCYIRYLAQGRWK